MYVYVCVSKLVVNNFFLQFYINTILHELQL